MDVQEAIETAARGLDALIAQELDELRARGVADEILDADRERLAAWRQDVLAALWVKLEGRV